MIKVREQGKISALRRCCHCITEGNFVVKTWTAVLPEILQQGSTYVNLGQQDTERVKEREGDTMRWIERERSTDRGRGREREKEKYKGDFDLRNSKGHYLSAVHVSGVQQDIRLQGRNSTVVPDLSLLIGMTLEICPLHSVLPPGR